MNTNPVIPAVSLILVARNEIKWIEKSLNSLLKQDYPSDKIELIIIDGQSDDGTREFLIEKVAELKNLNYCVKFYDNPRKILCSGWNIAIARSSGDIVCRIDAHSTIAHDYISIGVNELLTRKRNGEKIAAVGGWIKHRGHGKIGKIISYFYSSPFGTGNSPFRRNPGKPIISDTAVYALYWRNIFDEIGYFDEKLTRNEDTALHIKMIKKGYQFVTHPEMQIEYFVRSNINDFLKKAFNDGRWTILSGPYHRHKMPLIFVIYLLILLIKTNVTNSTTLILLDIPLLVYIIIAIIFALKETKNEFLILFILFFLYHVSYGIGNIYGIIINIIKIFMMKCISKNE